MVTNVIKHLVHMIMHFENLQIILSDGLVDLLGI